MINIMTDSEVSKEIEKFFSTIEDETLIPSHVHNILVRLSKMDTIDGFSLKLYEPIDFVDTDNILYDIEHFRSEVKTKLEHSAVED